MAKYKRYYGIKYPFTSNNDDGYFIDLNESIDDKVSSDILHTILTTKGTRLRMPEFGTRLIDYIFEPNDEMTWETVKNEVFDAVSRYVKGAKINNIDVYRAEEYGNSIFLDIRYSVIKGNTEEKNKMLVKI